MRSCSTSRGNTTSMPSIPATDFLSENPRVRPAPALDAGIDLRRPESPTTLKHARRQDRRQAKRASARQSSHRSRRQRRTRSSMPHRANNSPQRKKSATRIILKAAASAAVGRGMRVVRTDPDQILTERLRSRPRRESGSTPSAAPTSSSRRFIRTGPKHIEVQILGDQPRQPRPPLGTRLFRPASTSEGRRNCPRQWTNLDPTVRQGHLRRGRPPSARTIGYDNAGTVEFLYRPGHQRILLHRGQPPDPGRTHRDRARHRNRPGQAPDPHRPGTRAARRTVIDIPEHRRDPMQHDWIRYSVP